MKEQTVCLVKTKIVVQAPKTKIKNSFSEHE